MNIWDFRPTKLGGRCQIHPARWATARFRVALYGYPLTPKGGLAHAPVDQLRVCGACCRRLEAGWDEAFYGSQSERQAA